MEDQPVTITHFERVRRKRKVSIRCEECGMRFSRSHIVEHTINPFNVNEGGVPKTRQEVAEAVTKEIDAWAASIPPVCSSCAKAREGGT
jgi:hypothetical protein